MSSKRRYTFLIFLLPFLFGWLLLCIKVQPYQTRTAGELHAQYGVLDLQESIWAGLNRYYLSCGWGFYPNEYLTPGDLKSLVQTPFTYLMSGNTAFSFTPSYRSGTYHLTVLLSPESRQYAIELPKISGNYQLWINGQCYVDTVSPYMVNISHAIIIFEAASRVEIVLNADSILLSQNGLVNPPALGSPSALWTLMIFRMLCEGAAIVLAVSFAIASCIMSFNRRKRREGLSCLFFCLCYAGSVGRVPIHMLSLQNRFFQLLIAVSCFGAIFGFFLLLGSACHMPRKWNYTVYALGLSQYVLLALVILSPLRINYKASIHLDWLKCGYIILVFLALTVSAWWALARSRINDYLLFAGEGTISAALLYTVVYTQYEPFFYHLPIETAMFIMLVIIGISNARYLILLYKDKLRFEARAQAARSLAVAERQRYKTLNRHMEQLIQCKHEMRSQFLTLLHLHKKEDSVGLLLQLQEYLGKTEYRTYCNHSLLNAILTYSFPDSVISRIVFTPEIMGLPERLPLEDIDLCCLVANLLDNAIEGCDRLPDGEVRQIFCSVQIRFGQFSIKCVNTCPDDIVESGGFLVSSKPEPQSHGYGLRYVRACVKKYGGLFHASHGDGRFAVHIAIPFKD